MEGLEGRRGCDVDVGQEETRDGNHLEAQFQAPPFFLVAVQAAGQYLFADRRIVMDDVRPHADHVDIHVAVEEDVISQVTQGLAGQADHVARPYLIADAAQAVQAILADLPAVMAVLRMEGGVEVRIARFDAQEIAVGTGLEPAAVRVFRLFADAEGQAQFAVAQVLDVADEAFDVVDEGFILPFAGLEGQGSVTVFPGPAGHGQDIVARRVEAFHFVIALADAAVFAVFDAVIGKFDKAPVIDDAAHIGSLDGISRIIESLEFIRIGNREERDQIVAGFRLGNSHRRNSFQAALFVGPMDFFKEQENEAHDHGHDRSQAHALELDRPEDDSRPAEAGNHGDSREDEVLRARIVDLLFYEHAQARSGDEAE